jgi:peptidoglycan/LPS O-acetylase OafA/YrhL
VSWTLTGYFHTHLSPSLFVTTYLGYFVIGGVLGFHWAEVKGWLSVHRNWLLPSMLVAILAASSAFVYDLHQFGRPAAATNVFQPLSVVYTLGVFLVLLASGTWFEEVRPKRQRLGRTIKMVADASFGIYLVHPLFVHGWLSLAGAQDYAINPYLNTVLTGGFGVVFSMAAVFLVRQLPFSEAVIGTVRLDRKKLAAVFHSAPSEHRPAVGDR